MYSSLTEEVKSRLDIIDVAKRYGINVNRNNKALCCFHKEKTPSLSFHKDKQIYKCFSCGKGGDVVMFVKELFNINFKQAMMRLNYDFNLNLPIGQKITEKQQKEMQDQTRKINLKRYVIKEVKRIKDDRYFNTLSDFIQIENDIRDYAPKSKEIEFDDKYVRALHKLPYVSYLLDLRDAERSEV